MSLEADILGAFESHSPDEIRAALNAGQRPVALIKGKIPIDCLIELYLRSSKFRDCFQANTT